MATTTYKLVYFDIKARAELPRILFAVAGREFEDYRYEGEKIDESSYTPAKLEESRKKWEESSVRANAPFDRLPYLEIRKQGTLVARIAQSMAIARFLAQRFRYAGRDEFEQGLVDMYNDQVSDFAQALYDAIYQFDGAKRKEQIAFLKTETIPRNLAYFENKLAANNTGYLVGPDLTYADLHLFIYLEFIAENKAAFDELLSKYDHVRALHKRISTDARLAKYLEKNKSKPFGVFYYDKFLKELGQK